MISRRYIRVKVMQALYTRSTTGDEGKPGDPQKGLQKQFDLSRDLFQYIIFFITEVARYAEKDSHQRSAKHLPSSQDLNVNTKIAGNEALWKIKEDAALVAEWKASKPEMRLDKDLVRRMYLQLSESDRYKQYIADEGRNPKEEKAIIIYILNDLLLKDEVWLSHMEESYSNWDDDAELIVQLANTYLQKPGSSAIQTFVPLDKAQYARTLLTTVLEKDSYLEELITPKLKNWDPERIASLDMILMKMGVAEFLYFETIPPKVTINEYIELAKDYSTAQSGQFINGILDSIHKELAGEGKLQKKDFKKA